MREILFKIKVKLSQLDKEFYNEESDFIESQLHNVLSIDLKYNNFTIQDKEGKSVITIFSRHCEVCELMQYTGLTDKNGVKIFEGDKVLYDGIIGIVSYDNVMFMVRFEYTRSRLALGELDRDLEVIGNIHDK